MYLVYIHLSPQSLIRKAIAIEEKYKVYIYIYICIVKYCKSSYYKDKNDHSTIAQEVLGEL